MLVTEYLVEYPLPLTIGPFSKLCCSSSVIIQLYVAAIELNGKPFVIVGWLPAQTVMELSA